MFNRILVDRKEALLAVREGGGRRAEMLAELDRIMRSSQFQTANREAKLLRNLVENHVLGYTGRVMERGDPDRLELLLAKYYREEGTSSQNRIVLDPATGCIRLVKQCCRLFISHQTRDANVAEALTGTLRSAFEAAPEDILCTSVPFGRLQPGDDIPDILCEGLEGCEVIIGIFGPGFYDSRYQPLEVAGAWLLRKRMFPLLIGTAKVTDMPGPLRDLNALRLSELVDCYVFLDAVERSTSLFRKKGVGGDVAARVQQLVRLAA